MKLTLTPVASGPVADVKPAFKTILVAIHGIGSQSRGETIRHVARRFREFADPELPLQSLGYFHLGKDTEIKLGKLDTGTLDSVGVAEVFWADLPREAVAAGDTLEETKSWGTTVASRAHVLFRMAKRGEARASQSQREKRSDLVLERKDFDHAAVVLEEIVEALGVLEKVLFILDKMGIFTFHVAPILRDYLDDVQVVVEFPDYRRRILARFHETMSQIVAAFGEQAAAPNIYLVAHSEGSVVSFLAMLQALSAQHDSATDPARARAHAWIDAIRGFMTIGSPIDKHLTLWPELWQGLHLKGPRETQIQWRNYYDLGDPVGFELDSARAFLLAEECNAFAFSKDDDIGFSRYWFPGKAHVDYWDDPDVFRHFIEDVVKDFVPPPQAGNVSSDAQRRPEKPGNRLLRGTFGTTLPYVLFLALQVSAVFLLLKGITAFGTKDPSSEGMAHSFSTAVLLFGLLLVGVTVAARLPRLVKTAGLRWHALALAVFALTATPILFLLPVAWVPAWLTATPVIGSLPGGPLVALAAIIPLTGWIKPSWERRGRFLLVLVGALIVLSLVSFRFLRPPVDLSQAGVASSQVCPAEVEDGPPIWPLLLSGAAFVYLWWLGMLLFDLAFVWHRYIRWSMANKALSKWYRAKRNVPEESASAKLPENSR